MSVQASVVLATARTLLNDDAANNWSDNSLIPKLQQAHNELQVKLKRAAAPVMRGSYVEQVPAGSSGFANPPSDLVAPIRLWETSHNGSDSTYILMTESGVLPHVIPPGPAIVNWAWIKEIVNFSVPAITSIRQVLMEYWRAIPLPTSGSSLIGFINGELYLAPRTAALAAGSVGQLNEMEVWTQLANDSLMEVILSNRGRATQIPGASVKP